MLTPGWARGRFRRMYLRASKKSIAQMGKITDANGSLSVRPASSKLGRRFRKHGNSTGGCGEEERALALVGGVVYAGGRTERSSYSGLKGAHLPSSVYEGKSTPGANFTCLGREKMVFSEGPTFS